MLVVMTRIVILLFFAAFALAQPRTPVVVELFTSEGCSSCPPADTLLSRIEESPPDPGIEIIALGEHVDYWDQLGWRDRFSSPLFSSRQQDYGRAFRLENIYTPQMVVNGQVEFLGSDNGRAVREIRKAAQGLRATVELSMLAVGTARLKVEHLPPGTRQADMLLAITEMGLETDVQHGENSGRRLRHANVVRSLVSLGVLDTGKAGAYSAETRFNLKPEWRRENVKLVLLVQDRATRRILGAATMRP
jgi:hypothetical protein